MVIGLTRNWGIIPARAGFTSGPPGGPRRDSDHPRSRGVYEIATAAMLTAVGSSPLARGLHRPVTGLVGDLRIIPARAGFTRSAAYYRRNPWDHPRSRGVYHFSCLIDDMGMGSSPLARGLPTGAVPGETLVGIIPARAGFTVIARPESVRRGDHPRSRGVYRRVSYAYAAIFGSSPLARGLHHPIRTPQYRTGIIPARAGFTCDSSSRPRMRRDHPRSRGVYASALPWVWRSRGSSPLARGLHGRGWF